MTIIEYLEQVTRLFIDTAPMVYYVEADARYLSRVDPVFDALDANQLIVVTSPITLAECLVIPIRDNRLDLQEAFTDLVVNGANVLFSPISAATAESAAELRARYNLSLPDALQVAVALELGCEAILTNDKHLDRVTDLRVIVLEDLTI